MRFTATIELGGRTATGIHVPEQVLTSLGAGRRPAVVVGLAGYSYRTTVGVMGGRAMLPLAAEHRTAAGVGAGDEVEVDLELDTAPRVTALPDDLVAALAAEPAAQALLDEVSASQRKEWVRWVQDAKKPETRAKRVAATVEALREGRRTR